MGYMMIYAPCVVCKKPFASNPNKVPSFRVNGVKEPICKSCLDLVNEKRKEKGLEPFPPPLPGAYEPEEYY